MTINDLKQINNNMLKAYLVKNGWLIDDNYPNKKLFLFIKNIEGEKFSLTIPVNENAKDYIARAHDIVCAISELEEISKEQVLYNICHPNIPLKIVSVKELKEKQLKSIDINQDKEKLINRDRISFRIISKSTEDGTLPIDYAAEAVDGLKRLVISAIYTENFPRRHFRNAGKQIDLNNYRMGQSKVGSYIFNIEIDVTELEQMEYNDELQLDNLPMSRKVIRRIQNGIDRIVNATSKDEIQQLIEDGYKDGLNANMCEAILALNTKEPLELETNIQWADNIGEPANIKNKVNIKTKDFYLIEKIANVYKEDVYETVTIEGSICQLNNDNKEEDENPKRYILIDSIIDGKNRKIKVFVSNSDYKEAYIAHGNNKMVRVKGELDKSGKNYILYDYQSFEILK